MRKKSTYMYVHTKIRNNTNSNEIKKSRIRKNNEITIKEMKIQKKMKNV